MDGTLNNKVYINPNFKRIPQIDPWSIVHPNTTNSYKCLPQMQNDKLSMEKNSNRRIYINPNFKKVKQEKVLYSTVPGSNENFENIEACPKLISKSKYSLVANINKRKLEEGHNCREDKSCNSTKTMQNTDVLCNQMQFTQSNKHHKGVPIIKSRYTIVRKNKVVSENKRENKSQNLRDELSYSLHKFPIASSSLNNCYTNFNNSLLINHENRSNSKHLEKIAKIKISKYKTVPITYLKNNLSAIKAKESKLNLSAVKFYTNTDTRNKLVFSLKNNRYKLTRSNSKPVANVTNPSKPYTQTICKNAWHNQSTLKLLKANFKINNIPCRLFSKYGKCLRKDYGKCEYLHDKKHVSLCRKFIKGICHDSNCPLSHELTANKMPTCFFYLKGICTKENCPYLHIKLSDKIKTCHDFMRGYCEKGDTCKFRHVKVNQCKKLKVFNSTKGIQNRLAKLKKGKMKNSTLRKNITTLSDKKNIKPQNEEQTNINCRYYKEIVTNEITCKNIKPTRCKIGSLPSFIQL